MAGVDGGEVEQVYLRGFSLSQQSTSQVYIIGDAEMIIELEL